MKKIIKLREERPKASGIKYSNCTLKTYEIVASDFIQSSRWNGKVIFSALIKKIFDILPSIDIVRMSFFKK